MEEKIPCIKYDSQLWEYIKPYLEKWGYDTCTYFKPFNYYNLIILNFGNNLGYVSNVKDYFKNGHNRELVTNVEEFLERAAKLKCFTYKRKDIMEKEFNINKLEVGMIVEYKSGDRRLILPDSKGNLFLSRLNYFKPSTIKSADKYEIYKVYKIKYQTDLNSLLKCSNNLELIWEKPKEVELTIQEIADKFGISVEQLKIKK